MGKIEDLEREIESINDRNKRVELEKSWETSLSRKVIIFVLTYFSMVIYFYVAGLPEPLINSVVPAVAFVISSMSLPLFKRIWLRHVK